ncbi:tetratricopeptide repeat protein [Leptolyngbya sp. 15MV]|nr:tetratricopeptide repeat protein [Leptolyngbya sp. 15MV]
MDQRQTQIKEQAGLTESRLNQDFIDFTKRWGPTVLAIVAIAAIGWTGYHRWQRAKAAEVDAAFRELTAASATANPSPESLRGIAETYRSVRGVAPMALLQAGDSYLRAVRLGMKIGTTPQPDGTIAAVDLMTEGDRTNYLNEAQALYQRVLDDTGATPGKEVHAIAAAYGLAAVHESRGELDRAKAAYDRVIQLADRAGFAAQIEVAKRRAEALAALASPPRLFTRAEFPISSS